MQICSLTLFIYIFPFIPIPTPFLHSQGFNVTLKNGFSNMCTVTCASISPHFYWSLPSPSYVKSRLYWFVSITSRLFILLHPVLHFSLRTDQVDCLNGLLTLLASYYVLAQWEDQEETWEAELGYLFTQLPPLPSRAGWIPWSKVTMLVVLCCA